MRIFFAQIGEGLQTDGNVKIKGLGTFKVVTVDARKSKDVNTGENTIIPAHNKISFTPDSALAELLNKPYAHFESTYILSPEGEVDAPESDEEEETSAEESKTKSTQNVEEPEIEIVVDEPKAEPEQIIAEEAKAESEQIIAEESKTESEQIIAEETKAEPEQIIADESKTEPEQIIAEETKAEPEQVVEGPKADDIETEDNAGDEPEEKEEEDPNADEDENVEATPEEKVAYANTFKRHDLNPEEEDDDNDKGHGKKLGIAIILFLLILAVVGLVAWMSDPNIISKMRDKLTGKEPVATEIIVDSVEAEEAKEIEEQIIANKTETEAKETNDLVDTIEKEETVESKEEEEKPVVKQETKYSTNFKDDFISYMKTKHPEMDITDKGDPIEEKLGNASRLTLVSLRHYGSKDFWVYIYLYNKDVIKNPNYIKAGTKIKVPMLDNKKFVNPDSEHSILTAKEIQHQFVK